MRPSLLIAEGDFTTGGIYRRHLSRRGYEVDSVTGGIECVNRLAQSTYDLLLLDWKLPWGGGDGVLDLMRSVPHLTHIPVILVTDDVPEGPADNVDLPVAGVLRRPFSVDELLETVRSVLTDEPTCVGDGEALPDSYRITDGRGA